MSEKSAIIPSSRLLSVQSTMAKRDPNRMVPSRPTMPAGKAKAITGVRPPAPMPKRAASSASSTGTDTMSRLRLVKPSARRYLRA